LIAAGVRSSLLPENLAFADQLALYVIDAEAALALLFDPQTSGGLLLGIAAERAETLLAALRAAGDAAAAVIGVVAPPRADGALIEVAPTG
jgi:selenide,water dikinase